MRKKTPTVVHSMGRMGLHPRLQRATGCGLHRAAFWRSLGFPNLVLARVAKAKKREQRLKLVRIQEA